MAGVFYFPLIGTPTAPGNQLSFFEAGTDVPLNVWTDSDLSIAWAQPIILNAAGESDGPIYVSSSPSYKVVYEQPVAGSDDEFMAVPGYPVDFVSPSTIVNVMTTTIFPLTNAQIKALPTTPLTVYAAPATGLRVKVIGSTIRVDTTAGNYTNLNATYCALAIYYSGMSSQWAQVGVVNDAGFTGAARLTTLLAGSGNHFADLIPYVDTPSDGAANAGLWTLPNVQGIDDAEATALVIAMDNNGSGDLTGGNAANTGTLTLYTVLESVA